MVRYTVFYEIIADLRGLESNLYLARRLEHFVYFVQSRIILYYCDTRLMSNQQRNLPTLLNDKDNGTLLVTQRPCVLLKEKEEKL